MKTFATASGISLFLALLLLAGCKVEADTFDINCPPFDNDALVWFPYEPGDAFRFVSVEDSTVDRRFQVSDSNLFADTTYQSLIEDEACNPYTEFLVFEQDEPQTALNFTVTDLATSAPGNIVLTINFADSDFFGSGYLQQVLIGDALGGGVNTEATAIDSLTLEGMLYTDVVRLDLIQAPDLPSQFFNDIRRIWVAPGSGIIRFLDESKGAFNLIP